MLIVNQNYRHKKEQQRLLSFPHLQRTWLPLRDWGGLIINEIPINACGDDTTTVCEAFGEGGTGYYGGNDPLDDSGVLKYVRVDCWYSCFSRK